jgi:hypothetical protein
MDTVKRGPMLRRARSCRRRSATSRPRPTAASSGS